MDIVVERLRRRPLFYYEAINKQLNEGGPRLIWQWQFQMRVGTLIGIRVLTQKRRVLTRKNLRGALTREGEPIGKRTLNRIFKV